MFDFREFNVVVLRRVVQPLVVIVNRNRQDALGLRLADHIIVENLVNLFAGSARRRRLSPKKTSILL